MSKVVAPLGSFSASGKIGKSLVFFSHLGRNVVRGLVTPANPKSETQGDQRLLMAGLARPTRAVVFGNAFLTALSTVTPSGQTWVSAYLKAAMQRYGTGTTGVAALKAATAAHDETAEFEAQASALGLVTARISYAEESLGITPGEQLFALAQYSEAISVQNPGIFGSSAPWDEVFIDWASTDVAAFASAISAAVS